MFHLKTISIQLFWILEERQRKWLSWEIKQCKFIGTNISKLRFSQNSCPYYLGFP